MKKCIRPLLLLCLCMIITFFNLNSAKADTFQHEVSEAYSSSNINKHEYSGNNAESPKSCLYYEKNGDFTRAEYLDNGKFIVERFDKEFNLTSEDFFSIDEDCQIFGGIYVNDDYIFVASGRTVSDTNAAEPDITITKYDKKGNRIHALCLKKTNTVAPFGFGSCSFLEKDGSLYIRTCHIMMPGYDGINHQASMMIKMNIETCGLESIQKSISNYMSGYVSHSFNQFLAKKNGLVYACDHGDAFFRGIEVLRFNKENVNDNVSAGVPFEFDGAEGDNVTGAMLGGFAISSTHTLSAGTSKKQVPISDTVDVNDLPEIEDGKVKNIFIATTALDDISSRNVKWITKYDKDGKYTASNPYIVDLENDTYMLIWQVCEVDSKYKGKPTGELNFVRIDNQGNMIGEIQSIQGALSDCQPILAGNNVVWYVTDSSCPSFYSLPKDGKFSFDDSEISDQEIRRHIDNVCYDGIFKCYKTADGKKCAELKKVVLRDGTTFEELTIPSYITVQGANYAITKLAKDSVKDFTWLGRIEFPDTIEEFEKDCVNNCPNIFTIINNSKTPYIPRVNYIVYDRGGNNKGKLRYWFRRSDPNNYSKTEKVTEIKNGIKAEAFVDYDEMSIQFIDEFEPGKVDIIGTVNFYEGDIITPPNPPERAGYKFIGWYYFKELIDFSKPIESDLYSVTAKWKKNSDESTKNPEQPKLSNQKINSISNVQFNYSKLKKGKITFNINAAAKGSLKYKVTKGSSKYISVSKNGKVTLKKGCKKGTYKITITASRTKKYKAAKKVLTIKVI